ncbi:calcium/sodium antiporter [Thermosulfurimonas sp. F29]|uniref:calcium/sodium antiporter n=1 Tax=Thermosulfurimonas sp. F29 TaxID=2867247 RepID=UPI001C830696|nr:calcium/sodium antiporter [Thermosulfurimonas sp. F29]MBX6422365.1 calcium/sodium antiporter [Thermosulfurimonas sp. F29]
MSVVLDLFFTLVGLAVLVAGGEGMVRGAAGLSRRLGISPTVIGLTVVAFGTSAPELAVNVAAALRAGEISFGNIVGSNLANIGLGIGLAACLRPLSIRSVVVDREIPMMLLATAAAFVAALDPYLSGSPPLYGRTEGVLLLLFFGVFIYYNLFEVLRNRTEVLASAEEVPGGALSVPLALLLFGAGVGGLVGGAEITVRYAVRLAFALGLPKSFIGFTLIALGTSLPEIATSLVAVRRGETDLLIGNIVGSNIFNLLFILGITASIRPVPVPRQGFSDLLMVTVLSVVLFLISLRGTIRRREGVFFLALYLLYLTFKTFTLP